MRDQGPSLAGEVGRRAGRLDWRLPQDYMEWEEIGVLWQIPLAGQTNMHYHLLLACLLPLSKAMQTISLPSQPPFQQEVAPWYRSGWMSYWGRGQAVLEKPLFLNKRDRCRQYHHFPPLPVWNMDLKPRMTTTSPLMTMRKSLRESQRESSGHCWCGWPLWNHLRSCFVRNIKLCSFEASVCQVFSCYLQPTMF